MPEKPDFNYEEAMHGVLQTRTALQRALGEMDRLERLLTTEPRSFAPLAAATFRLRDRLIEDLETLEARLARGKSGSDGALERPAPDPREGHDVPRGDAVALGGQ